MRSDEDSVFSMTCWFWAGEASEGPALLQGFLSSSTLNTSFAMPKVVGATSIDHAAPINEVDVATCDHIAAIDGATASIDQPAALNGGHRPEIRDGTAATNDGDPPMCCKAVATHHRKAITNGDAAATFHRAAALNDHAALSDDDVPAMCCHLSATGYRGPATNDRRATRRCRAAPMCCADAPISHRAYALC